MLVGFGSVHQATCVARKFPEVLVAKPETSLSPELTLYLEASGRTSIHCLQPTLGGWQARLKPLTQQEHELGSTKLLTLLGVSPAKGSGAA